MYTYAMTSLPLSQARSQFFDVVDRAATGERITLTSRGIPRAMIVPMEEDPRPIAMTSQQAMDIFLNHQMDSNAWKSIRFPGDTIGEDGLG